MKTPEEIANEIVIEIFDDTNAPNLQPFAVNEISKAIIKARYDGAKWAMRIAIDQINIDTKVFNDPAFLTLLSMKILKELG